MSELDIAVAKMVSSGSPAHLRCGCPRWTRPDTFDQLMPDLAPVGGPATCRCRSASAPSPSSDGNQDIPTEQRRDVLTFDLSGAAVTSRLSVALDR